MSAIPQRVRTLLAEDLPTVLAWRNHPEVRQHMFTQEPIQPADHRAWFERKNSSPNDHLLLYEVAGQPMGFVNLSEKPGQRVGEWGFYAAPHAPRGTGTALGVAAIDHVFHVLGWHRLVGHTLASNLRSFHMHAKLGFRHEGTMREHFFNGAQHVDVCCFGLLNHEWPPAADRDPR